jgi:hypothetical protein
MTDLVFTRTFADGSTDHTDPHRPGHRFADVDDAARIAAHDAYEDRRKTQHYTSRYPRPAVQDAKPQDAHKPEVNLDQARELAWEERNVRMANAWRQNKS